MKTITIEDCHKLEKKFRKYTKTAEQHEFPLLLMVDMKMTQTIMDYESAGEIVDQESANAMFRVVLKTIGEDYSEYAGGNTDD
jgi:hypothetical protein